MWTIAWMTHWFNLTRIDLSWWKLFCVGWHFIILNKNYFFCFRQATFDTTPPTCIIHSSDGTCNATIADPAVCSTDFWSFNFSVQDTGGLSSVKPSEVVPGSVFLPSSVSAGTTATVYGYYMSDCCTPRATVVASDLLGNLEACKLELIAPGKQQELPLEIEFSSIWLQTTNSSSVLPEWNKVKLLWFTDVFKPLVNALQFSFLKSHKVTIW